MPEEPREDEEDKGPEWSSDEDMDDFMREETCEDLVGCACA